MCCILLFVYEISSTDNKQFVLGFFFIFGRLMTINNLSTNYQQKKVDNNSENKDLKP